MHFAAQAGVYPVAALSTLSFSWLAIAPFPALAAAAAPQAIPIGATTQPASNPTGQAKPAAQPTNSPSSSRSRVVYDSYILGPGDSLQIELFLIPELSGTFSIGPDGTMYLPRLRALYVQGLTVEELRSFLTQQFKAYVKDPQIYINPVGYRPARIYVGGEVRRPGYYTLSGLQDPLLRSDQTRIGDNVIQTSSTNGNSSFRSGLSNSSASNPSLSTVQSLDPYSQSTSFVFPTLFDALRSAEGITPYSNLSDVEIIRQQPLSGGGGKIRAKLNFLSMVTQGDESQNIRLFDGDIISVPKSNLVLREQIIKAAQTNINPRYFTVFVGGRVRAPGPVTVPQGASLNQAVIAAGGQRLLHGKVEFVRFTSSGDLDRRLFNYDAGAASETPNNPILAAGDIISVQDSILSASAGVLNEFSTPFLGIYSLYRIFTP